jgi:CHAT domain/WD domain, G-beta repeat
MLGRRLQAVEFALVRSAATVRRLTPADEQPVQEFGRQLFEFVFPAEVRENLNAARRQAAQEDTHVQVRLRVRPAELAALPWEFLYDPGRDDYLCLSTPLVRYLDVLEPRRPLAVTGPLRILGMVARPGELDTLNADHEQRRLQQALAGLESTGGVQLTWVAGQTWWDLQAALDQGGWHILHFIGHGGFDQHSGEGILALAGEDGGEHRLAASDLGLLLGGHRSLRLVVLNSCETARANASDVFSGTAAVLIRRGIPAVVAMQYDISDDAAIAFARGLYTALGSRHPVDRAVTRARRAIKLARRNTLEWATPVLYLRSPRADLFDLSTVPVAEAPTAEPVVQAPPGPGDDQTSEEPRRPLRIQPPPKRRPPSRRHHRTPTGTELAQMRHDGKVCAVAIAPDGTWLATASGDGTARLWAADGTPRGVLTGHHRGVLAVAIAPDGTWLATASSDGTVRLWAADGTLRATLTGQGGGSVLAVAIAPDGTWLATAGLGGTVRLWTLGGAPRGVLTGHAGAVRAVAIAPDGTWLAAASYQTVRLWAAGGTPRATLTGHVGWVRAVAIAPDGTWLATASSDGTVRLWAAGGTPRATLTGHAGAVLAVAIAPDGTWLATGSDDQTARLWTADGTPRGVLTGHDGSVLAVAIPPHGTWLATGSDDQTARLWAA